MTRLIKDHLKKRYLGLYSLLKNYLKIYQNNTTWSMSLFVSIGLTLIWWKFQGYQKQAVIFYLETGIRVFPSILSLSLAVLTFIVGSFEKKDLDPIKLTEGKDKFPLFEFTIMHFTFFVFMVALSLFIFWMAKIIIDIFPFIYNIQSLKPWLYCILVFAVLYCPIIICLSIIDTISSLYSFFLLRLKNMEKTKE